LQPKKEGGGETPSEGRENGGEAHQRPKKKTNEVPYSPLLPCFPPPFGERKGREVRREEGEELRSSTLEKLRSSTTLPGGGEKTVFLCLSIRRRPENSE
jgi:hypothetical protein